jgi:L-fucose isomerase-like protein
MKMPQPITVGLLFMRRKRPGFDPAWGKTIQHAVLDQLEKAPFDYVEPTVSIVDDASLREALAELDGAGADVLLVVQPTMSDANLGVTIAQHAGNPVILWATPEKQEGDMISSCSLVGAHTFGSTLRLMNEPFELVYGMPGEADTIEQLNRAVRCSHACGQIVGGKIGLVGYHAPGFIDMLSVTWETMSRLGLQVRHFGLHEFLQRAEEMDEAAVKADLEALKALGLPRKDVEESDLEPASRLTLAMKSLIEDEALDALAVQCWPEMPNEIGQWPYLGMFRLGEEGFPVACEGDVDGALTLWVGSLLGFAPSGYLSDWLEHTEDTVTLWHGGNCPLSMLEPVGTDKGPHLARHFNNKKPMVVEGTVRAGIPVTIFRIWNCDGEYHVAALEGETIEPPRRFMGTNCFAKIDGGNMLERFETMLHEGLPHHVGVFPGRHADALRRFARLMDLDFIDV